MFPTNVIIINKKKTIEHFLAPDNLDYKNKSVAIHRKQRHDGNVVRSSCKLKITNKGL